MEGTSLSRKEIPMPDSSKPPPWIEHALWALVFAILIEIAKHFVFGH